MKHYMDQQREIEIMRERYDSLKEEKKMLQLSVDAAAIKYDKQIVSKGKQDDRMLNYTIKLEKIEKEMDNLQQEIGILKVGLKNMESNIRKMDAVVYRIFSLHEIEGLTPKQIIARTGYSKTHVYRILDEIDKILKNGKKWEK